MFRTNSGGKTYGNPSGTVNAWLALILFHAALSLLGVRPFQSNTMRLCWLCTVRTLIGFAAVQRKGRVTTPASVLGNSESTYCRRRVTQQCAS